MVNHLKAHSNMHGIVCYHIDTIVLYWHTLTQRAPVRDKKASPKAGFLLYIFASKPLGQYSVVKKRTSTQFSCLSSQKVNILTLIFYFNRYLLGRQITWKDLCSTVFLSQGNYHCLKAVEDSSVGTSMVLLDCKVGRSVAGTHADDIGFAELENLLDHWINPGKGHHLVRILSC